MITWRELKKIAVQAIVKQFKDCSQDYTKRLKYEFSQIELQGAEDYWTDTYENHRHTDKNPNGLIFPFLLGLTNVDPIKENIPHNIQYHPDYPDIDIDFLPIARNFVKEYAAEKYGHDKVCSVGLWQRYKPKLAITDTCRVLGASVPDAQKLTKALPDEFDDMDFDQACETYPEFKTFADDNQEVVAMAYKLVKLIKAQGRHAGGLIISSVPVRDHIPLTLSGDQWTSAWTEGRSTQLSKFGFVKFDILGLTNLLHIWICKQLIKENKGVTIDWSDMDPEVDRAGWEILPDGSQHPISFKDDLAIKMAHERKVETIFQFETDLAKSILQKGGVKNFSDLVIYTSLGRPGPLPLVDEYVSRRDVNITTTDEDPRIEEMLKDTFGIIVFQEQLSRFFAEICGFTIPEAEAARKAVAKKWADKLAKIKDKMIAGATKTIGHDKAISWWGKIESFARYCFNRSHAIAYIIISYRCLWLKAHYPAEWWAAVMSNCKPDRLAKYMGIARAEGVQFGAIDFRRLGESFTVSGDTVTAGLRSIKGIGIKAARKIRGTRNVSTMDEFIKEAGKSKIVFERIVKLGAFDEAHPNRKALWHWYLYKYGTCQEARRVKAEVNEKLAWAEDDILAERERRIKEYFKQYPNRKKIPRNLERWKPKINPTLTQFEELFEDFDFIEKLEFEKQYLGYYWNSPLEVYECEGHTIADGKVDGSNSILEAVIEDVEERRGANGRFLQLSVTDGVEMARVMIWNSELMMNDEDIFTEGMGIKIRVRWKDQYSSFSIQSGTIVVPLEIKDVFAD
jgi:DNA polymerase-3 subunit alpha